MDKRWLEFRKEELAAGYSKVAKQVAELEVALKEARRHVTLIRGQVLENNQLIEGYDKLPKPKMEVPIFGSPEEAEAALVRRGQPPAGTTEEELRSIRKEVFDREAKEAIETISQYNERPEEAV